VSYALLGANSQLMPKPNEGKVMKAGAIVFL